MRVSRAFQGALLGLGGPMGWLAWRVVIDGVDPLTELATHPALYLYLTLSTVCVFMLFGGRVAKSEKQLKSENVDLSTLAITDALTGMRNARFFHARLEQATAEAVRHSHALSLVLLDLDHFKAVNDTHGHAVGDEVLAAVAGRLDSVVRAGDCAARVGGEEFAVLLVDTELEIAALTAERLREAIASEPFQTSAGALRLTLSGGVAQLVTSFEALFAAADAALYEAKAAGRNRVALSSRPEQVSKQRAVG